jgi:hypothetical protein
MDRPFGAEHPGNAWSDREAGRRPRTSLDAFIGVLDGAGEIERVRQSEINGRSDVRRRLNRPAGKFDTGTQPSDCQPSLKQGLCAASTGQWSVCFPLDFARRQE